MTAVFGSKIFDTNTTNRIKTFVTVMETVIFEKMCITTIFT